MAHKRTIDLNADVGEATAARGDRRGARAPRVRDVGPRRLWRTRGGRRVHDGHRRRRGGARSPGRRPSLLPGPRRLRAQPDGDRPGRARARPCPSSCGRSIGSAGRPARLVDSVKAHGALYEEVAKGGAVYETFRDAVRASVGEGVALVLPSGCRAMAMALRDGIRAFEEGFCDRAYRPDGGLVARATPGAVLAEPRCSGGAGAQLGPRRGRRQRRVRAHALGGHAVHPRRLPRGGRHRDRGPPGHGRRGDRCGRAAACMTPSIPVGEVRLLGDRAFLIGVADAAAARALASELVTRVAGAAEVVCGSATVMVHASDPDTQLSSLRAAAEQVRADLTRRTPREHRAGPSRLLTVPCRFDGPDLAEVAALAGCRPDEVAALLTAQPLTAAVMGFSPGFAYLEGLPSPLARVPRRPRPRPVVPAGSVAIANGHAAVYPTASPGGWHLVGRTGVALFSPEHPPYAVLAPGDSVRFTVAGVDEVVEPEPVVAPPWSLPSGARAVLEIVAAGVRAVVQDGGRRAVAAGRRPRCRSGRPGVVRAGQPTRRQRDRAPARSNSRWAGPGCAASARATWPRWEVRRRSASTARRSQPASSCRWPRARCSRWVACAADAAATCRWRAASSDPSGSGAPPRTN